MPLPLPPLNGRRRPCLLSRSQPRSRQVGQPALVSFVVALRTGRETVTTEPDHLPSVDRPAAYLTGVTRAAPESSTSYRPSSKTSYIAVNSALDRARRQARDKLAR